MQIIPFFLHIFQIKFISLSQRYGKFQYKTSIVESFTMKEIPFESLALLGMTKEKVLSLDKQNLVRLMSGQRTDVLRFDFYRGGRRFLMDGKLFLKREPDSSVKALIVPVRKQIKNDFNLTGSEMIKLYTGALINKNIDGQRYLLQLDRETNEVVRARTSGIKLPFDMDSKDRERLLTGKSIQIRTETGNRSVKLDLLDERRFAFDGETRRLRYVGLYFTESDLSPDDRIKYNLKEQDVQRLLDGYKTGPVELDGHGAKGKIGLVRNEDKSVSVQVYPVRNELNNDLHLEPQQMERLKRGETVSAEIGGKIYVCQLDRETNDLLRMQKENLIPEIIRGYNLKDSDRERLLSGQSITFSDVRTGEPVTARLDLNHVRGIDIKDDANKLKVLYLAGRNAGEALDRQVPVKLERDRFIARNNLDKNNLSNTARAAFDERQKFNFDYYNPGVMSYIQTDRNRGEFMVFCRQQSQAYSLKV
jgi:hypothetical protein